MARTQVLGPPVNRAQHCFKIHQIHIPNVQVHCKLPAVALKTRLSIILIRAVRKDYDFTSGTVFRAFMAHIVIGTENRLILWGAKVNNLIAKGQIWRLLTPAFLHVNLIHLLLNCYSVHSLGPHLESLGGSKRFLVVFAVAAVTTSCLSFLMCKSPAVGASGAICGLIGALAVYSFRHRKLLNKAQENLGRISRTVAFNMVLGLMSHEVDNWGHLGGFVGGAFALVGPWYGSSLQATAFQLSDMDFPVYLESQTCISWGVLNSDPHIDQSLFFQNRHFLSE
ncbi:hypothetical protein SELMODRAFT_431594 [Selaginella moellendorffii]|uniref:Peptidase S54 rhomboid domain-containing protein n=1 Tax=Selaginella moellendorffii TaxID=88036 RepID=D8TD56_SELML|nr:hypothetical protein SELMODRAFT_431594 [Selaginella moellendorffii]